MPKVLSSLSLKWKILKNWIYRFSKFAPFKGNKPSDTVEIDGADNIIDIFQKLCESKLKDLSQKPEEKGRKLPPLRQQKLRMHHSSRLRVL